MSGPQILFARSSRVFDCALTGFRSCSRRPANFWLICTDGELPPSTATRSSVTSPRCCPAPAFPPSTIARRILRSWSLSRQKRASLRRAPSNGLTATSDAGVSLRLRTGIDETFEEADEAGRRWSAIVRAHAPEDSELIVKPNGVVRLAAPAGSTTEGELRLRVDFEPAFPQIPSSCSGSRRHAPAGP